MTETEPDDVVSSPSARCVAGTLGMVVAGLVAVAEARIVGATPFLAQPPFWPSDHAGVVATVRLS